jgi:hypothetical protein
MKNIVSILFLLIFAFSTSIIAEELTAKEIIDKSLEHKSLSYENSEAKIKMILIDKEKNQEDRAVLIKSKKIDNQQRTLSIFSGDVEINGVKFLSIENKNDGDEQYLFYPAQNKINRVVSSSNKKERFLGTDFTYSDLEQKHQKDANFKKLDDANIGKNSCYVIESTPNKTDDSQYLKAILFIRKNDFIPLKVKFFNKDGDFFKEYLVKKVKTQNGKKIISLSTMSDLKRKHTTILELEYLNENIQLKDSDFYKESLK